jgi:hypothetical protein
MSLESWWLYKNIKNDFIEVIKRSKRLTLEFKMGDMNGGGNILFQNSTIPIKFYTS